MLRLLVLGTLILTTCFCAPALAAATGGGGGEIKCDCTGSAKCTVNGKEIKVNCGASTPTKQGPLPKMEQCQGTAFACMKGKDCITIEGGYKFHKTNCGSGGKEATGAISTAGCIEMGDADFEEIKKLADAGGAKFDVKGPGGGGGGKSGR